MIYKDLIHKQIEKIAAAPNSENALIFLYTFTHEVFGVGRVTWKEARELAGVSISEAAKGTGISAKTLKRYEDGKTAPQPCNASKLVKFYGMDLNCINTRREVQSDTEN